VPDPPRGSFTRLELGGSHPTIGLTVSPHISLLSMLVEVVGGYDRGLPMPWRRRISAALPEAATRAAAVLARRGRSVQPDFIVPISPVRDASAAAQLERLRDLSADDVMRGIEDVYGDEVPEHWERVTARPRAWLADLADGLNAVRLVADDLWTRARSLLDREIERIGVASVRGGAQGVLGLLRPQFRFRDGTLLLPDAEPAVFHANGRPVIVVPMIAGTRSTVSNFDSGEAIWLGYGLPGLETLFAGDRSPTPPPADDGLALVVGPHRAKLLRYLRREASMGELATALGCAPSTATYHCEQLVSAGLVRRHRTGQTVLVLRTPRGDALVDLLSG
jgi:DNA-binding transcriptional ArsR family regulator